MEKSQEVPKRWAYDRKKSLICSPIPTIKFPKLRAKDQEGWARRSYLLAVAGRLLGQGKARQRKKKTNGRNRNGLTLTQLQATVAGNRRVFFSQRKKPLMSWTDFSSLAWHQECSILPRSWRDPLRYRCCWRSWTFFVVVRNSEF